MSMYPSTSSLWTSSHVDDTARTSTSTSSSSSSITRSPNTSLAHRASTETATAPKHPKPSAYTRAAVFKPHTQNDPNLSTRPGAITADLFPSVPQFPPSSDLDIGGARFPGTGAPTTANTNSDTSVKTYTHTTTTAQSQLTHPHTSTFTSTSKAQAQTQTQAQTPQQRSINAEMFPSVPPTIPRTPSPDGDEISIFPCVPPTMPRNLVDNHATVLE